MKERRARVQRGGTWLREQRLGRGLTQIQLAEMIGTDQAKLSAYENGRYEMDTSVARRIAAALELSELVVWRGLELPLPQEMETDEAVIAWAWRERPDVMEQITGRKRPAAQRPTVVRDAKVTQSGDESREASQG